MLYTTDTSSAKSRKTGIEGVAAQTILIVLLTLLVLLTLMPVLITVMFSLRPNGDFMTKNIWEFPSYLKWSNYSLAIVQVLPNMLNTLAIDIISTVLMTLLSTFVAYLFVRKNFPAKNLLFMLIILPMLVPGVVSLTPQYLNIINMHMMGSWFALILPYIAGNQIASIFLYRTFMRQQPKDIYEAGEIDGASDFRMFTTICLPLSLAIMMVQSVAIFSAIYNDYMWPLMIFVGNNKHSTLMPQLQELAANVSYKEQGASYALYLLSGLPLIVATMFSLKFFISGEFAAGLKL